MKQDWDTAHHAAQLSAMAPALLAALAQSSSLAANDEDELVGNVGVYLDGLAYAAALIFEFVPDLKTKRDLRLAGESFGKRVTDLANRCRAIAEETGNHPLETFGGTRLFMKK